MAVTSGHGDNSVCDFLSEVGFGGFFHLREDHRAYLFWGLQRLSVSNSHVNPINELTNTLFSRLYSTDTTGLPARFITLNGLHWKVASAQHLTKRCETLVPVRYVLLKAILQHLSTYEPFGIKHRIGRVGVERIFSTIPDTMHMTMVSTLDSMMPVVEYASC